jgi:uncharacterized protein
MILDARRIPRDGVSWAGEEPGSVLADVEGADVEACGPIRYELGVRVVGDEVVVSGSLSAEVRFVCCRCGNAFASQVREPSFGWSGHMADLNESVDLTPAMREAILLAFPTYPVCRPDCGGLCPQCGADLKRGRCRCRAPRDPRWGALDGWSARKKSNRSPTR